MSYVSLVSLTQAEFNALKTAGTALDRPVAFFITDAAIGSPNIIFGRQGQTPTAAETTGGTTTGTSAAGGGLRRWEASKAYAQGDIVVVATASGTLGIGDLIIRNSSGTSRTSFDATEAALWTEVSDDPDLVKTSSIVDSLTSTSSSVPLSAAQGKVLEDGKRAKFQVGHPLATAATTHGHTVTSSSNFNADYAAWKAFQAAGGGANNEWATASVSVANFVLSLPLAVILTRVDLQGRSQSEEAPLRWAIDGSLDNTAFVTLLDHTGADKSLAGSLGVQSFTFTNTTPYRHYRFRMTAASGGVNPGLRLCRYYHEGINILPDLGDAALMDVGTTSTTVAAGNHTHSTHVTGVSGTAPINSSGGTTPAISISAATPTAAGSMSGGDKNKLDGIASGAEVNVQADWNQATTTSDSYIQNKPTLLALATTGTPAQDGTAALGTSTAAAKADHVHPTDTSRAASSHTHAASDLPAMSGASAGAAGATGLVPTPIAGQQGQFLRGDASWASPAPQATQSTTYGAAGDTSSSQNTVAVTDAIVQPVVSAIGAAATSVTGSTFTSNIGRSHAASRWRVNGAFDAESATDLTSRAIAATFEGTAEVLYKDDYPSTPFYSRLSAPQYRGIIDRLGVATSIAYSMRRLLNAYAGPCLRLRRSSDSAERDLRFGFNGRVDLTETYTVGSTVALGQTAAAFVGSGDGSIVVWYDQSGNARHANTTGTQFTLFPKLYRSGVLQTLNSLPCVSFLTNEGLQTPDSGIGVLTATANHHSILSRQQMIGTTAANRRRTIVSGISSGLNRLYFNWATHSSAPGSFVVYLGGNPNDLVGNTTDVAIRNDAWTQTDVSGIGYVDGAQVQTYANPSTVAPANFHLNGAYPPSTAESSNANHSEFIVATAALSAAQIATWHNSAAAAL